MFNVQLIIRRRHMTILYTFVKFINSNRSKNILKNILSGKWGDSFVFSTPAFGLTGYIWLQGGLNNFDIRSSVYKRKEKSDSTELVVKKDVMQTVWDGEQYKYLKGEMSSKGYFFFFSLFPNVNLLIRRNEPKTEGMKDVLYKILAQLIRTGTANTLSYLSKCFANGFLKNLFPFG